MAAWPSGALALQRIPSNKKPPCIRNRSQFSYKTMDKTMGYCSKTIGCTQKSGFLFAGTRCIGTANEELRVFTLCVFFQRPAYHFESMHVNTTKVLVQQTSVHCMCMPLLHVSYCSNVRDTNLH